MSAPPPRSRSGWTSINVDPIVPPSAASGGVPDPTPEYLALASQEPRELASPRAILIVVDLNGTLIFRRNRSAAGSATGFDTRPHAQTFVRYCIDNFKFVFWSSARPKNVTAMSDHLVGTRSARAQVVAVWNRDNFGLTKDDYYQRVQCYKRLTRLWDDPVIAASHPEHASGGRWDQTNTVLIDDSAEKARSEPHNLIQIPEFTRQGDTVDVIPQVHDYINILSSQANISSYIRAHPFRLDPAFSLNDE